MTGSHGGDFGSGALGHLLYDESAHSEGVRRRRSYRRRGLIVSAAMLVVAVELLILSLVRPMSPAYGGAWFGAILVSMPVALAIAAAWSALRVGFRRVYEGGIVEAREHGRPRVWPFPDIVRVQLIVQPDGDTFIGLELNR